VTISLTDDQLENLIADLMDLMIDEFDDNEDYELLYDGESGYISDILPTSRDVKEFFDNYRLFDETALVMEFTKTPLGVLKTSSTCINMNIDLGKIIMEMDDTVEIPADSSDAKFSLKADVSYKSVNGSVKVDFPTLSEENIIDFEEMIYPEHDWDGEYCYHFENYYLYDDYIEAKKDTFYMSLQTVISDAAGYGYEYDLSVDGDLVTLTETSGNERFSKAEMKIGSDEISVDGVSYTVSNPVVMSDGFVYVDTVGLNYIFGFDMEYASIDLETNEINLDFERKSPQCHHTEEEIYGWFEEEYEEECYHYDVVFVSGEFPYYGVPYIKIRDIIDEVWQNCEVHYENGVLTLTDNTGLSDFTTLVITMDSNEYIIDGVSKRIGMPATEYRDSVYVDVVAITELFGFELTDPHLIYERYYDEITESEESYMSYNATLARKSLLCPHSDEELEDYYKWWE